MNELIGVAVLVATLFGGTIAAEKIFESVRKAALTKAAQGLPRLSPFADSLTKKSKLISRAKNLDRTQTLQRKDLYEIGRR